MFVQALGLIDLFARRMISRTKCIKAVPEHRAQVNKASSSSRLLKKSSMRRASEWALSPLMEADFSF